LDASNQLIFNPRATYQRLIREPTDVASLILWLRGPTFIAVILGCCISLLVSAALNLSLALSTAFCWTFVPLAELVALQFVIGSSTPELPRARRVDLFFAGHTPWLIWIALLGMAGAFLPLTEIVEVSARWMLASGVVALVWSLWIDYQFFRVVCGASRTAALGKLLVQRLISWTLVIAVFAYGSFWQSVVIGVVR
jgi:hypothetical protein